MPNSNPITSMNVWKWLHFIINRCPVPFNLDYEIQLVVSAIRYTYLCHAEPKIISVKIVQELSENKSLKTVVLDAKLKYFLFESCHILFLNPFFIGETNTHV